MSLLTTLKELEALRSGRNMGLIAAGVAFFAMFSLFPGLAALIAVFGLLADPVVVQEQAAALSELMPPDVWALLNGQLTSLLSARPETLGWASFLSLVIAFWSARAAVAALMQGLNEIAARPARGGIRQTMVALLLTAGLIGVAVVALLLVVVVPVVLAFLPLGPWAALAADLLRWGVAICVLMTALGLLYRFGPNLRGQRHPWITWGAVLAVSLWLAASWGFSFYLTNFGNYNEVYGSIGAVAALLMWFYISAYLVLLGAGLNTVLGDHDENGTEM